MTPFVIKVICIIVSIQTVFCKPGEYYDGDRLHHTYGVRSRPPHPHPNSDREYDPSFCETDECHSGECVPVELCDGLSGQHPPCGHHYERKVCCPKREQEPSESSVNNRVVHHSPFPKPPVCGQIIEVKFRITGGSDAPVGNFPWMAALWYSEQRRYLCGGSIITSRHVMTAAHCILSDLDHVRLGTVDLIGADDGPAPVHVRVKKGIRHEGYNGTLKVNDIGLLVLVKEVTFNSFIKPICLPPIDSLGLRSRKTNFVGEDSIVAGWGAVEFLGPQPSRLQFAQLQILSNKICQMTFHKSPVVINDSHLCAADPGLGATRKDSCTGDSGGPLMYVQPSSRQYYQIGIVAYGYQCGKPGYPGLYTRVDKYLTWLEDKVKQNH